MKSKTIDEKRLINRINRISGQLNALKMRIEADVKHQDPYELIRQMNAIKGAVAGMTNSYIEYYAKGYLLDNIKDAKSEREAMTQIDTLIEIMKIYSR